MAITTGILRGGTNNHETTSEEANAIATDFIAEGIVDAVGNTSGVAPMTGGFSVNAQGTPDMTVAVGSGVAYVEGTPSSQNAQTFRVKNSATSNVTISANSSGSTKYDWVYISLNATNLNDPNSAADNVATLTTSRSSSASTDDGTPPTYGYPLAVVTVANGETAITNSMIRDVRVQAAVSAGASSSADTWTSLGYTPGTVTYNGNRSYDLTIANTDVTNVLSNGMRLKLTRTTAPPTQCADLETSSSQYFNRASGSLSAGFANITSTFTAMGWVKLESYTQGGIISRIDTNDGWGLRIQSDGTVRVDGRTTSAGQDYAVSYQSIPLNKWVHVAAAFTISDSTNTKIYIDGVEVPSAFTNGADGAIGVPAVALEVGALAGSSFFDGKLAQVAVFSSALTGSTIRSYMSQGLSGSETNLLAAYSLNNSIDDLTANGNNLTAQGGAAATSTDSPFNATEYGIITKNSFSTNTTLTVQVPEGYAIPTSGGVSAVSYSTQEAPYGFPSRKDKWFVDFVAAPGNIAQSTPVSSTWYNIGGFNLTVPIGSWNLLWKNGIYANETAGTACNVTGTLSTANNSESDSDFSSSISCQGASGNVAAFAAPQISKPIHLTSATPYYMNLMSTGADFIRTNQTTTCVIRAELTYV